MLTAVGRTSTQSLYRRFFTVRRHFSEAEASFFLNPDFITHVALVAVAEEDGKPVIAGGGRYVVIKPGQAEVAFAVVDQFQGQGAPPILRTWPTMRALCAAPCPTPISAGRWWRLPKRFDALIEGRRHATEFPA